MMQTAQSLPMILILISSSAVAAFDASTYSRSQQLDPSVSIYWNLQPTSIKLAIRVKYLTFCINMA